MMEHQHFIDLQQENGSFGDPKSWLSEEHHLSSTPHQTHPSSSSSSSSISVPANNGNFDRVLYRDLVEMIPLVQSLMERRANTSFTRRASLVYTKTPCRESNPRKIAESKGRKTVQNITSKKRRDLGDNDLSKNMNIDDQEGGADDFSIFSTRALAVEKDREELIRLREQVEDLQKKLLEKDEVLKSTENSMNQMNSVHSTLDELKRQVAEKDSLIKSAQLQLSNAKIKLADKQAALEKLEWEARTSNEKIEKLQEDLDNTQWEIRAFRQLFEGLIKNDSPSYAEVDDTSLYHWDHTSYIDAIDEIEIQEMEEARKAYIAAVAAAKENPSEESLAIAGEARVNLQAFVFGPNKSK
eukprot:TRINITY_DN2106_c0_g1_i1.p1 TRINITY_DN2106_c0_g1~~TRINITY_DN2106_c0_g1_i1.p1  ORF type:complete len:355 (-),score=83.23 TRINITY_DN2106_c0_g1_i1:142-1206(-)